MNAENFSEIIKNPSHLYQIPYQELKSLVMQYPYCRNLHHLLLTKLLQTSHPEHKRAFEAVLEKTATLSIDRKFLYRQMRALQDKAEQSETFELGEEYLELRDLSTLSSDREPIPVEVLRQEDREAQNGEKDRSPEPVDDLFAPEKPTAPPTPEEDTLDFGEAIDEPLGPPPALDLTQPLEEAETESIGEAPPAFHPGEQLIADCATLLNILETPPREAPAPPSEVEPSIPKSTLKEDAAAPTRRPSQPAFSPGAGQVSEEPAAPPGPLRPAPKPKSSFKSWVKQFQPSHIQPHVDELMEAGKSGKKKKKKKKKDKITAFAEQSLIENEEVATETLAELLVSQERFEKAIRVYERLRLIFPEKSGYFAEKIEKLKKQL
jgi:hypothetical protein